MPTLVGLLKDPEISVRQQALASMSRFPEEAVPHYVEALKDKDVNIRYVAANHLGNTGAAGQKAIPKLLETAKTDDNGTVRYYATEARCNGGEEAIPALAELAKSKDANAYQTAMFGLHRHGAKAKAAVPALIDVLNNGDTNNRMLAAQTLGAI